MAKRRKSREPQEQSIPKTRKKLEIKARTTKQKEYLKAIRSHDFVICVGPAGTGKTYLSALMALNAFINQQVDKIVITRPAVMAGGEDIGFLPGTINEKLDPYMQPIFDAFKTYWSPHTIEHHIKDGNIEIVPLAYMRGRSFKNAYIICDEAQNCTKDNLLMLMTRLGEGSTMVITGDPIQSDINGFSCLHVAEKLLSGIDEIEFVTFTNEDVVRHPTVAKILAAWHNVPKVTGSPRPKTMLATIA